MLDPQLQHVQDLLLSGRSELAPEKSRRLLGDVVREAQAPAETDGGSLYSILAAQALRELALLASTPAERSRLWFNALKTLDSLCNRADPSAVFEYASIGVDFVEDRLARLDHADKVKVLLSIAAHLEATMKQSLAPNQLVALMTQKSAVFRQQSTLVDEPLRTRKLLEAERCAARAVSEVPGPAAKLELAMARWALARSEKIEIAFVSRLNEAEQLLLGDDLSAFAPAAFAKAFFFRMTYRPLEACEAFSAAQVVSRNRREVLRNATIYAEAATQLWYGGFPSEIVDDHVAAARNLLEKGIAAGYKNARTIVDLAFLRSISDGDEAGTTILSDIHAAGDGLDWQAVVKVVTEEYQEDPAALGLALGITESGLLTRIGTFVWTFLQDDDLAQRWYAAAVRMGPHDYIAITNLARFLVSRGDPDSLKQAERLLSQAQQFSDFRFKWWRDVLDDFEERTGRVPQKQARTIPLSPLTRDIARIQGIKSRFRSVSGSEDAQARGYALEELFIALCRLTPGITDAEGSYRFKRPESSREHQVDAFFVHRSRPYRVECKWTTDRVGYNEVMLFSNKLDVAGVSGLIVSMSGFEEGAISAANEVRGSNPVLLMDGDEVSAVMEGRFNFDYLLSQKRSHFDMRSKCYYRPLSEMHRMGGPGSVV